MLKSTKHKFENLLWSSGDGRPNLFSGSIIHITKLVGIVPSCVSSSKREVKLLSAEEVSHYGAEPQKLASVEKINISGKEESKKLFEEVILLTLYKLRHGVPVCIVVPWNPLLCLSAPTRE